MATVSPEAPQAAQAITHPKKITRMNPARRKAAKAKAEAQEAQTEAVHVTGIISPQLPLKIPAVRKPERSTTDRAPSSQPQPKVPSQQIAQTNALKQKPNAAAPPLLRSNTKPSITQSKPTPLRTNSAPTPNNGGSNFSTLALNAPALVTGGLLGCAASAAILLGVGLWHDAAGADSALLAAKSAQLCINNLVEEITTSLKTGTYSAAEALDMLRRTSLVYASSIPNGAPVAERIFREIDTVRLQRGREVDAVVAETYTELEKAGRRGAKTEEMQEVVVRQLLKLAAFASRATQDIVTRNPALTPYKDAAAKSLRAPPEPKVPTVKINMAVRQKGIRS